ncbi:MAG: acetamidase/formamidase family protein [Devosia sp.]
MGENHVRGGLLGKRGVDGPKCLAADGLTAIFNELVDRAAGSIQDLPDHEWQALERAVSELFATIVGCGDDGDSIKAPGHAALFQRITLAIERRLHDPDLTPRRIAKAEGISERYLQKLFEQNGESFSQHLRERRLQRAHAALMSSSEARTPVAELAFNAGFGDAANFSRLFKEKFGLPPGAFRARQAEKGFEVGSVEQRGWPLQVLESRKLYRPTDLDGDVAANPVKPTERSSLHHLPASAANIHWGYFSHGLRPVLEIESGDRVVIETLSQHASDAPDFMIAGDPAAEEVFHWTRDRKTVDRRGAGPLDASVFGRGAGEGFGVHICAGPIFVNGAEPGDVIEVCIEDMAPRPSRSPGYEGRCFGSNVAAWWGYQYNELIQPPKPRETVTIYEIFAEDGEDGHAEALLSYRWNEQIDPFGVRHKTYDYPGIPIDRDGLEVDTEPLKGVRIPLRPHFGVIALAPRETGLVDSVPPAYFGGNLDNWRLGTGTRIYLPVSVPGGLLSIGDPHAAQGDGELSGTAIECSMTGRVAVVVHKKGTLFDDLDAPLIETPDAWILTGFSHPNYLAEFGAKGQSEVYSKSSLDLAMKDAFRKARRFLITTHGLNEDEAISVISAAVDFGVTQVVDGNWGVHAIIKKSIFPA